MIGRKEKVTRPFKHGQVLGINSLDFLGVECFGAKQKGSQWIPAKFNSRSLIL